MGILADYAVANYEGNTIEVEGRTLFPHPKYKLVINNHTVEEASVMAFTEVRMHGIINSSEGSDHTVVVIVKQGLLRASFALEINGKPHPLSKVR